MRVLHVLDALAPGGAERMVLELCRRRARDVEVAVAGVMGLGPLEAAFRAVAEVHDLGRPRKSLGLGAIARLIPLVGGVDIVHTHLFAGDTWGRVAAVLARHPAVVTTEHNVDREEPWRRLVRRALSPLATTVAVSEAVARSSTARDVRVIPNGVDLTRFSGIHRGGAGILALGRREPQKGFDVLLAALPPGARVRIAGEGPFAPPHPQVEWLGLRDDVPALLAEADVLAVPSRWEGFGLAALEGMAAGVPVVASAVDGLRELVGDAGILVPPDDAAALRGALTRVLGEPGLAGELGRRGRERARAWSIDVMVARYDALYRRLA